MLMTIAGMRKAGVFRVQRVEGEISSTAGDTPVSVGIGGAVNSEEREL